MTKRIESVTIFLGVIFLSLTVYALEQPMPVKIYSGRKSETKTYMHQFVDSPDGRQYAFRYFSGSAQPTGRKGGASPCEVWVCKSDLTGHHRAFTSPITEEGHGADVIVWVTNDVIYYAGISYEISARKVRWRFDGRDTDAELPLARMGPVNANKLYVGIRRDPKKKGWYWLDPSSSTKPPLHLVNNMKNLVQYYNGSWEDAEATYIYQNPSDTKLYVVVYDSSRRQEYAFVLHADGTVYSFLGHNRVGYCANGHVLWYDDTSLMAGNQRAGRFDPRGNPMGWLALWGDHISLSPDKQWWVGDDREVRLQRYGASKYTVISGDVEYFGDFHPSFSRDGKYVFFAGRRPSEPHPGVFRVDVSGITGVNK